MTLEFIQQLFDLVLVPLLAILTIYFVKFVNIQTEKIKAATDNELLQKYVGSLNDIITACVVATNQTYVDAMKGQNAFDKEAQQKAFDMTFNAVKEILSEEAEKVLSMVYEDLDMFIKQQIEFIVKMNKTPIMY